MWWWERLRQEPRRLRILLSYSGIALALGAVIFDRTWLTWLAIAVLALAVLIRLRLRRQARLSEETREDPDEG